MDSDNDGLTNSQELLAGADPNKPDSDGDGLLDGIEVYTWHTNPLKPDSDSDGLYRWRRDQPGQPTRTTRTAMAMDSRMASIRTHCTRRPGLPYPSQPLPAGRRLPAHPGGSSPPSGSTHPPRTPTPTRSVTPQPLTTDLSISISNGSGSVIPGTTTIYTILVTNKGSSTLTNVKISDTFPSSLSNITWLCMASPGSLCQTGNGTGNVNALANLAAGGTATLTVNASILPNATGSLANTAKVDPPAGITDPNPGDNQATDTDLLTPKIALSLSKTDNQTSLNPGQATTYTIIVFNNGPSAVTGVNIADTFPDQLTGITWSCSATPGSSCAASGSLSGNIGTQASLNPGGTVTLNANATVKNSATGILSNTASITSPIDPGTNNKSATDTTNIVPQANLAVVASAPLTATISTTITYTVCDHQYRSQPGLRPHSHRHARSWRGFRLLHARRADLHRKRRKGHLQPGQPGAQ